MAWTTPTTVNAGDVLTAARYNQDTVANAFMGRAVYANEAARDAAITSPEEGMICYLTAPTVPAATGEFTYLPSGITTIYDGSVWVCVTPIGAFQSATGTSTSTSFTTSLSGSPGTNPSVTLVTGTTVMLHIVSSVENNGASSFSYLSLAVSGASTIAAADANGLFKQGARNDTESSTRIIGGLTPGTNTFTLSYRVNGSTGSWSRRFISVQGIA
jgi:hypothetical protein